MGPASLCYAGRPKGQLRNVAGPPLATRSGPAFNSLTFQFSRANRRPDRKFVVARTAFDKLMRAVLVFVFHRRAAGNPIAKVQMRQAMSAAVFDLLQHGKNAGASRCQAGSW